MSKKTVSILHSSNSFMSATNAKERNVWKKVGDSYVFSHVEKLEPTHTMEEFVEAVTGTPKQLKKKGK